MSRLAAYHLYDQAALEALVLGFRRADGDRKALRKLVRDAPEARWPRAYENELRARLTRFRELKKTPKIVIDTCRRELEPRAFLLDRLRRDETIAEWEIFDLALRAKKNIPDEYELVSWIADAEARRAGPTPEMSDGWTHNFSITTPSVREVMYGSSSLSIGGVETLGGDRGWVHPVASIPRVRRFFEELLALPPPPLEEYRRWYPHLHALHFCVSSDASVPADGPLAWEYATELAGAARAIRATVSMLRNCERRGWCVQILCE